MELWIFTLTLLFLQDVAQPIRVHDSSSKFLIVANSQDQNDETPGTHNDLQYHKFDSNRSHPKIKKEKKNAISTLLGFEKTEEKSRKGSGNLLSPSVEITPANSQYLGYTSGSHLQDTSLLGESPLKNLLKNDQHFVRSPTENQTPLKHIPKKYTNVKLPTFDKQTPFEPSTHFEDINLKLSKVESTIHRPKTSDRLKAEKPIHEYFSSDINNLIEKAKNMDHKRQLGSPRKHRNSEDDLGHRSDKYEEDGYLDHQPSVESIGEYHVYHEAPEKKKKKEIHYHQHKHLHDHDHDQKHSHKHQSGHHHDHGHDHRQKHAHVHGHDSSHWHVQHEKDLHHHHSQHDHDHHSSHDHKHHGEHSHRHASDHHHGHDDHHDHHEDHKNWHSHKHHSDHDHKHGHDHKHKGKHGHDHSHSHKHKHSHSEKHAKH